MSTDHDKSIQSGAVPVTKRLRNILTAISAVVIAVAFVGIAATWPSQHNAAVNTTLNPAVNTVPGVITSLSLVRCEAGRSEDRLPDGSMPSTVECPQASVQLSNKIVSIPIPARTYDGGIKIGDDVTLSVFNDPAPGSATVYAWHDFDRQIPLVLIVGLFAFFTILVGRGRGVGALAGLAFAGVVIFIYALPALSAQHDPTVVALSATTAIMGVVIYFTHGFSTRTTVAFLGTTGGLALTAITSYLATGAAHLRGINSEDSLYIATAIGAVDLRGIVLAATLIAVVGLLNDVTITQASAVWEIAVANPSTTFSDLFKGGMRIGRDHLASTVYTVAFAYTGAALPALLLINLSSQGINQVLTSSAIGEEIVRTAAGGIALALAVPVTTGLAALTARAHHAPKTPLKRTRPSRKATA